MLYVELDGGIDRMQPQDNNWEPPSYMGDDGLGAPVYGPFWACKLAFSYLTLTQFNRWFAAVDGAMHTVRLPHPVTGAMTDFTCYVHYVVSRMRTDVNGICTGAVTGADITLTRIRVT